MPFTSCGQWVVNKFRCTRTRFLHPVGFDYSHSRWWGWRKLMFALRIYKWDWVQIPQTVNNPWKETAETVHSRGLICRIHEAEKTTKHYNDVIMSTMASQITSLTIVYTTVYSGADERKQQSSASLAFVRGIHQWPVNSLHKGLVKRKMFPFDDVIMEWMVWSYNEAVHPPGTHLWIILGWENTRFIRNNALFCYISWRVCCYT